MPLSEYGKLIKRLEQNGKIKLETLATLEKELSEMNRDSHIELVVHPTKDIALVKTIDNEKDAQETLENIRNLKK